MIVERSQFCVAHAVHFWYRNLIHEKRLVSPESSWSSFVTQAYGLAVFRSGTLTSSVRGETELPVLLIVIEDTHVQTECGSNLVFSYLQTAVKWFLPGSEDWA
jgi:hypothetical protein